MARAHRRRRKSNRFVRLIFLMVIVVGGLYSIPLIYLYVFQRSFVFEPSGALQSPEEKGLSGVTVLTEEAPDGTKLLAWYAEPEDGKPTVLYFHGNARNVSSRSSRFAEALDAGYGLLAPSHRGYPGSEGRPSEDALIDDGLFWFDWIDEKEDGPIILHGESLGTGIAVAVAAQRDTDAVVLEAPYTATVDIAADQYPWIPVASLMKDQFRSRDRIKDVSEPVLILHGTADQVIPYRHGEQLSRLANEPKLFVTVPDAGHADLWDRGLWGHVEEFVGKHVNAGS